jgi:hypothetical protein
VLSQHQAQRLKSDVIALLASMGSKNSLESILDRLIVGVEVAAFDCFDRAAQTTDARARDVNLRHGMKGAAIIINLMRFRDERWVQASQSVTVGKVKIQSGQPLAMPAATRATTDVAPTSARTRLAGSNQCNANRSGSSRGPYPPAVRCFRRLARRAQSCSPRSAHPLLVPQTNGPKTQLGAMRDADENQRNNQGAGLKPSGSLLALACQATRSPAICPCQAISRPCTADACR